jgi:thioredoxin-like negative regulator of GroEL
MFAFLIVINRAKTSPSSGTPAPATQAPALSSPDGARATLNAAQSAVATNPADPEAQLALARSLADNGQPGRAWIALQTAVQVFRDRGQAGRATQALVTGLELAGGPKQAEPALVDATLQALFMAASQPDQVGATLSRLQAEYPDWPQLEGIVARADLHQGDTASARQTAEGALARAPDDSIIRSVLAEIDAASGNQTQAKASIDDILSQGGVPRWLQFFLTELRRNLASTS